MSHKYIKLNFRICIQFINIMASRQIWGEGECFFKLLDYQMGKTLFKYIARKHLSMFQWRENMLYSMNIVSSAIVLVFIMQSCSNVIDILGNNLNRTLISCMLMHIIVNKKHQMNTEKYT